MVARGKRAPKTERRLRGVSDLLLVVGTAAFAVGLMVTVHGLSELPGGMLPDAWWGEAGTGGALGGDDQSGTPPPMRLETQQLPSRSPPRAAVNLRGWRDYRLELVKTAALARRSWSWMAGEVSCQPDPCSLAGAMPGNWVPRLEENRPP